MNFFAPLFMNEDEDEDGDGEKPDTTNMPNSEKGESAEQRNQEGQGLKILTPNQVLTRLPISLAQLNAGNNSEKLKAETRQLLFSLYPFKEIIQNSL